MTLYLCIIPTQTDDEGHSVRRTVVHGHRIRGAVGAISKIGKIYYNNSIDWKICRKSIARIWLKFRFYVTDWIICCRRILSPRFANGIIPSSKTILMLILNFYLGFRYFGCRCKFFTWLRNCCSNRCWRECCWYWCCLDIFLNKCLWLFWKFYSNKNFTRRKSNRWNYWRIATMTAKQKCSL